MSEACIRANLSVLQFLSMIACAACRAPVNFVPRPVSKRKMLLRRISGELLKSFSMAVWVALSNKRTLYASRRFTIPVEELFIAESRACQKLCRDWNTAPSLLLCELDITRDTGVFGRGRRSSLLIELDLE